MNLQISKWGNSLALRIPSEVVRRFDLHDGDTVDARITVDGALSIRPSNWSRAAFASEVDSAREAMPFGASVMDELRGTARY
jgi:antitoxin MazE